MSAYIVNQKWHENQSDNSEHIVVTASKLLKAAIRETENDTGVHPRCADVQDAQRSGDWMPNLLQTFLDNLICPEAKKSDIGHSIVQAVKPRSVIAPLPFALGVTSSLATHQLCFQQNPSIKL